MRKAHNVVHVSRLKIFYRADNASGPLDVTIDVDGSVEQEVSTILQKKRANGTTYYLTLFDGDPASEAIWMPASDLVTCKDLVQSYEDSTRTSTRKKKRV